MKFRKIKLSSGATLYYVKNKINKITSTDIVFACGSRCDTIPGLAHFCEHMFFTGTKNLTKEEITKKYYDFFQVNAYTSSRSIFFAGNVLTEEFADYVKTVATMITESTFKQKEIEKEKKVVIQEIARSKDDFYSKSYNFNMLNLTKSNRLKLGTLGSEETVNSIQRNDVVGFVNKYFVKENLEVFCTSPLGASIVKRIIERDLISKLKSNIKFEKLPLNFEHVKSESFVKNDKKPIGKSYVYINFVNDIADKDEDYEMKLDFLLGLLNDTSTGIMQKLRLENSLVYGGGFSRKNDDKNTILSFETECDKENVNEVVNKLSDYLSNVYTNGYNSAEILQQKRRLEYKKKSHLPTLKDNLWKLYDLMYYSKVRGGKDWYKRSKKITNKDVMDTIKKTFIKGKVSLTVYGDLEKTDLIKKKDFDALFNWLG